MLMNIECLKYTYKQYIHILYLVSWAQSTELTELIYISAGNGNDLTSIFVGIVMVLIEDGSSELVGHVWCKKGHFRKKNGFDDSFDVTKCLQPIDIPDWLHLCA